MSKKYVISSMLVAVALLFSGINVSAVMVNTPEQRKQIASDFIALMAAGNFQSAYASFNQPMKQALPPDKLKMIWKMLQKQIGMYEKIESFEVHKSTVIAHCRFQNAPLNIRISIDNSGKLIGLYFLPANPQTKSSNKAVLQKATEKEVKIDIGNKMILPGILTIPKGSHEVPAVVLVHGSGPQDRDETIGPNKPFSNLAYGLVEHGIAVLRYDKRTKCYPNLDPSSLTVEQETIADAVKMCEFLSTQKRINHKKIFILGHSLGGMLIPRIATKARTAAGFIMLAAPARPLEDLIIEQFRYIGKLNPGKVDIKDIEKKVRNVKHPELSLNTPASELPLGIPAAYWLDLKNYNQVKAAEKMTRPLLILQGGRDYQVTTEDFGLWKNALTRHKNVEFKFYPDLNHLFRACPIWC